MLSEFVLGAVLGQGGTATVFRATHRRSQHEVAIKVLQADGPARERWTVALRHETLAMAHMRHPDIAALIDFGQITDGDVRQVDPSLGLRVGEFWLAMELVRGSSLKTPGLIQRWEQLDEIVQRLLGALAHAHARGLIHRDLKPDNVMVQWGSAGLDSLKLLDFGIALSAQRIMAQGQGARPVVGTPAYMAPEQINGQVAWQGPWSDLYALGCLVWRLVYGRAPFVADEVMTLLRLQLYASPPWDQAWPRFDVPQELRGWLERALHKDPASRWERASQALQAWRRLVPSSASTWVRATSRSPLASAAAHDSATIKTVLVRDELDPSQVDTTVLDSPPISRASSSWLGEGQEPRLDQAQAQAQAQVWSGHVPLSWGDAARSAYQPPGWSLSPRLLGVRMPPLVGRVAERDQGWQALRALAASPAARLLLIEGAPGMGKSALLGWLVESARELTSLQVVPMRHALTPYELDGARGALLERYRAPWPFDREGLREHLHAALALDVPIHERARQALASALTEVLDPARSMAWPEQLKTLHSWFALLSKRSPVILVVDDAHRGDEALELALSMLEHPTAWPVLVVAAAVPEQLTSRLGLRLLELAQTQGLGQHLRLEPMASDELVALSEELYTLPEAIKRQVVARAAGVAAALAHHIEQWARRGVLASEIEASLAPIDPEALALQALSALGPSSADLWAEVCQRLGVPCAAAQVERWLSRGEVRLDRGELTLASAARALSEAQTARALGREASLHEAILGALLARSPQTAHEFERAAHHAAAAQQLEQAIELLYEATRRHFAQRHIGRALGLLTRRGAMIAQLDGRPDSERALHNDITLLYNLGQLGEHQAMERLASQVEARQAANPQAYSPSLQLRWLYFRVSAWVDRCDYDRVDALMAHPSTRQLLQLEHDMAAHTRRMFAMGLHFQGRLIQAITLHVDNLRWYERSGDPQGRGFTLTSMAKAALGMGWYAEAWALAQRCLALFEREGLPGGVHWGLIMLGDVALEAGRLGELPALLARHQLTLELGMPEERWYWHMNAMALALEQRRVAQAQEHDQALQPELLHSHDRVARLSWECQQLWLLALQRRWDALDQALERWALERASLGALRARFVYVLRRVHGLLNSRRAALAQRLALVLRPLESTLEAQRADAQAPALRAALARAGRQDAPSQDPQASPGAHEVEDERV